jgi:hypothetical protein
MEEKKIYTTICIKRRLSGDPGPPPSLLPGELAVHEVGNKLYVGVSTDVLNLSSGIVIDQGTF